MIVSKTMKDVFYFIQNSFRSRDIQIFVFPPSPLFLPVSHCFRAWSKINLKVYDCINCLNKNLITHFVWYLENEKRYDSETLAIDTVLNKEHFHGKFMHAKENVHQKLVPDPFFILISNPKQPLHARHSCKNKIFWKGIIKNLQESKLYFFFPTQSLLMDKVIKNKRVLELMTSPSSGYKTSSKNFLYYLYIIWPSLMV